jgi:hypothetical protein
MRICVSSKQLPEAVAIIDDEDYERVSRYRWRAFVSKANPNNPYCQNRSTGKTVYLHRFIIGAKTGQVVDHINRNSLDCRKVNLRICTPAQNSANRRKADGPTRYGKSSRYYGVSFDRRSKRFVAQFHGAGSRMARSFKSEIEAAKQYNEWARQHYGEVAHFNQI